MTDITETRKLSVQNVIVHISDVQRLARLFPQNSDNKTSIDRKVILCFTTKFFDGTKRSSKQSNIFSEDFPKRVREIEMSYWVYGNDDKIYIRLSHGSYLIWDSYVEISGQDSTWVNGTLKKIDDIISNMEPQPQWLRKLRFVFGFIFGCSVGLILWYIFIGVLWYFGLQKSSLEPLGVEILLKYFLSVLCGIIGSLPLGMTLEKLYPIVELQIGREHTFQEKRKRKIIKSAIKLGFVPLTLAVLYDLLKLVW